VRKLLSSKPHPAVSALTKPLLFLPEKRFAEIYSKKIEAVRACLQTFQEEKSRAEKDGRQAIVQLADSAIYLLLIDLDRFVLLSHVFKEYDHLVRHIYEKHLVTLIYEFFENFCSTHGGKILSVIASLPHSETHQNSFKVLSSHIGKMKKSHEKAFQKIRNTIGAHRDPNINIQIESIESLDSDLIRKIASDMESWHGDVYACLNAVVNEYTYSRLMIQEMTSKVS
jgi:hypothetical protein